MNSVRAIGTFVQRAQRLEMGTRWRLDGFQRGESPERPATGGLRGGGLVGNLDNLYVSGLRQGQDVVPGTEAGVEAAVLELATQHLTQLGNGGLQPLRASDEGEVVDMHVHIVARPTPIRETGVAWRRRGGGARATDGRDRAASSVCIAVSNSFLPSPPSASTVAARRRATAGLLLVS